MTLGLLDAKTPPPNELTELLATVADAAVDVSVWVFEFARKFAPDVDHAAPE